MSQDNLADAFVFLSKIVRSRMTDLTAILEGGSQYLRRKIRRRGDIFAPFINDYTQNADILNVSQG